MGDEAQYLAIFRDEANERLDRMVETLLALERGDAPVDAVDSLFREAHTIKGAAGLVQLDEIYGLAHAVEDVLGEVREGGSFSPALVEPLLAAADALRRGVAGESRPDDVAQAVATLGQTAIPGAPGPDEPLRLEPERGTQKQRSVRVPAEKLDRLLDLVGETVLHRRRLEHALGGGPGQEHRRIADELGAGERLLHELKDAAIQMRTLPLRSITAGFPRAVRDLSAAEGKEVELVISGAETELDRVILERLADPIVHVLRNAVAHGIETGDERVGAGKPRSGRIELRAEQRGGLVALAITDDGRGVAPEALAAGARAGSLTDVLASAGFSTAGSVTTLAGRGVGLDAVKRHVEAFGGTLEIRSEAGVGTEVALQLPLTLALLDVLLVERGRHVFALPLASVEQAVTVTETLSLGGRPALEVHGEAVPLTDLLELVGGRASRPPEPAPAVVLVAGGRRTASLCDRLLGEEEVVIKSLGPLLASLPTYLGAAILGDGRIALVLDPNALVRAAATPRVRANTDGEEAEQRSPKVLVVEDSYTIRELQRSILEAAGYRVETARDGRDASTRIDRDDDIDLVVTDVEMPEMDGFQLTQSIRAHPQRSSLPVVIVTSRGSDDDRRRGIEVGADAYMTKGGFDQHALLETVARLVGG